MVDGNLDRDVTRPATEDETEWASKQAQIDQLREEISALAEKAQSYVSGAGERVVATARDGAAGTMSAIRRNPGIAMAVAAGLGAGLGLIVTGGRSRSPYERFRQQLPELGGYSLSGLTASIERAVEQARPRERLAEVGGRIAQGLGDSGVQDGLTKTAERAMDWWDKTRKRVAEKVSERT